MSREIPVKVVKIHEDAIIPKYQHEDDAGFDLHAYLPLRKQERRLNDAHLEVIEDHHPVTIYPGQRMLIGTGLRFQIPKGNEVQVRPRSGLALKHGITVLNSPGTVDSGYKGEVGVILINHGEKEFTIFHGDRIAQAVVAEVTKASLELVDDLYGYDRGGGFGSSGVSA